MNLPDPLPLFLMLDTRTPGSMSLREDFIEVEAMYHEQANAGRQFLEQLQNRRDHLVSMVRLIISMSYEYMDYEWDRAKQAELWECLVRELGVRHDQIEVYDGRLGMGDDVGTGVVVSFMLPPAGRISVEEYLMSDTFNDHVRRLVDAMRRIDLGTRGPYNTGRFDVVEDDPDTDDPFSEGPPT